MKWTVETLNHTVDAEVEALPADMRARLAHIAKLIEETGSNALANRMSSILTVGYGKCGSEVEAEYRGHCTLWQQVVVP